MPYARITIQVRTEQKEELTALAERLHTSVSAIMRILVDRVTHDPSLLLRETAPIAVQDSELESAVQAANGNANDGRRRRPRAGERRPRQSEGNQP